MFEESIEDWSDVKRLSELDFVPLHDAGERARFEARGALLAGLGTAPAHRAYSQGAFFPHRRAGEASGVVSTKATGRAVIDNENGLKLGHAPGAAYDAVGVAMMSTLKAYRAALAAQREGESPQARKERLQRSQLRLFDTLPDELRAIAWPAVIAFSLTTKTWGHLLIDGVHDIAFNDALWDRLVLPARTKELMLATSACWQSSALVAEADGSGSGALFLLYGPPGTGKTACVTGVCL